MILGGKRYHVVLESELPTPTSWRGVQPIETQLTHLRQLEVKVLAFSGFMDHTWEEDMSEDDRWEEDMWQEVMLQELEPLSPGGEDHHELDDFDPVLESAQDFVAGLPSLDGDDNNAGGEAQLDGMVQAAPARPYLQLQRPAGRLWPVIAPGTRIGVSKRASGGWQAHIWLPDYNLNREKKGMQCFVGSFRTVEEAKQAHDKVAIRFNLRVNRHNRPYELNYPQERYADYVAEQAHWSRRDYLWKIRRDSPNFSSGDCRLRGVRLLKNKGKWNGRYSASVSVTVNPSKKKEMALGTFDTEKEAGMAYDLALLFVHGMYSSCVTNFQPGLYSEEAVQDMGRILTDAYPGIDFKEHETVLQCLLHN